MRMSPAKRNATARLRRAVRPLLYPTAIVGLDLYLFQHRPGGNLDFWFDAHPFADPKVGVKRSINDIYRHGREAGSPIGHFHGFYDGGIVDDISGGITTYPYSGLSLATIRSLGSLVDKIKTYQYDEEARRWRRSKDLPGRSRRPSSRRQTARPNGSTIA